MIGVGYHDEVVLGAAQTERALVCGRGASVHGAGDGRGPYERQRAHAGVIAERLHGDAITVKHVEDTWREARLHHQLTGELRAERHLLGRLEDERVPHRDGDRVEPERHHRREVEGRDSGDDAERLAPDFAAHPAAHLE